MRTLLTQTLLLLALITAQSAVAADNESPQAIVTAALDQVEWNPGRSWAYTQTGFEDETLVVSRFDPSQIEGDRWTLISIDNRPPTLEEIEAFDEEKQYEQEIPDDDSDIPQMIDFDSLALADVDAESWTYRFQPVMDGSEAEFADKLSGELKIAKSSGALEYLDVRNTQSIRPAFGVKIKTMHMHFDFAPATPDGPQVISEITAKVKGGAYLVVSFDEKESTRFSEFSYVGDQNESQREPGQPADSSL